MNVYYILICLVTAIVLLGTYKLGYYIGYKDGIEDGATLVTEVGLDVFETLVKVGFDGVEIEK